MKRFFFILLFYCLLFDFSQAQLQQDSLKQYKTDSNIVQDKRVNELVARHIAMNELKRGKIKGYRVQIHFGAEKAKAMEVRTKFSTQYQNVPSYFDYQQPYFKVRVGDFRTKLEAYKLLQEISGEFSGAFIVSDEIDLPKVE